MMYKEYTNANFQQFVKVMEMAGRKVKHYEYVKFGPGVYSGPSIICQREDLDKVQLEAEGLVLKTEHYWRNEFIVYPAA